MRPLSIWSFQWSWQEIHRKKQGKIPSYYASEKYSEKYEKKLLQRIAQITERKMGGNVDYGVLSTSGRKNNSSSKRGLGDPTKTPTKLVEKKRDKEEGNFVNPAASPVSISTSTAGLADGVGIGAGAVTFVGQLKVESKQDNSSLDEEDEAEINEIFDRASKSEEKIPNTKSSSSSSSIPSTTSSSSSTSTSLKPTKSSGGSSLPVPPSPSHIPSTPSATSKRKKLVSSNSENFDEIQL
jgi:hypothetical protein